MESVVILTKDALFNNLNDNFLVGCTSRIFTKDGKTVVKILFGRDYSEPKSLRD